MYQQKGKTFCQKPEHCIKGTRYWSLLRRYWRTQWQTHWGWHLQSWTWRSSVPSGSCWRPSRACPPPSWRPPRRPRCVPASGAGEVRTGRGAPSAYGRSCPHGGPVPGQRLVRPSLVPGDAVLLSCPLSHSTVISFAFWSGLFAAYHHFRLALTWTYGLVCCTDCGGGCWNSSWYSIHPIGSSAA